MDRYQGSGREALVKWAEGNPRVRRVWVYGADAQRNERRDTDLDLAIELAPAVDGDESIALWIANAEKWQDELEASTGTHVDLEWFDPDTDAPMGASARLAYERGTPDAEMH
jgi:predicted nucleotidyltransferase